MSWCEVNPGWHLEAEQLIDMTNEQEEPLQEQYQEQGTAKPKRGRPSAKEWHPHGYAILGRIEWKFPQRSLQEFADKANVSASTVTRWLQQGGIATKSHRENVAKILSVPADWLRRPSAQSDDPDVSVSGVLIALPHRVRSHSDSGALSAISGEYLEILRPPVDQSDPEFPPISQQVFGPQLAQAEKACHNKRLLFIWGEVGSGRSRFAYALADRLPVQQRIVVSLEQIAGSSGDESREAALRQIAQEVGAVSHRATDAFEALRDYFCQQTTVLLILTDMPEFLLEKFSDDTLRSLLASCASLTILVTATKPYLGKPIESSVRISLLPPGLEERIAMMRGRVPHITSERARRFAIAAKDVSPVALILLAGCIAAENTDSLDRLEANLYSIGLKINEESHSYEVRSLRSKREQVIMHYAYDILSSYLRQLLGKITVFADEFTEDTVQTVFFMLAESKTQNLHFDLQTLFCRGWISPVNAGLPTRYRINSSVKGFLASLSGPEIHGIQETDRVAHTHHFLRLAVQYGSQTGFLTRRLFRLRQAIPDIAAALRYTAASIEIKPDISDTRISEYVQAALALSVFIERAGMYKFGVEMLESGLRLIQLHAMGDRDVEADLRIALAILHLRQDFYAAAHREFKEVRKIVADRAVRDTERFQTLVLFGEAILYYVQGEYPLAIKLLKQCVTTFDRLNLSYEGISARIWMIRTSYAAGRTSSLDIETGEVLDKALSLALINGDPRMCAAVLNWKVRLTADRRDQEEIAVSRMEPHTAKHSSKSSLLGELKTQLLYFRSFAAASEDTTVYAHFNGLLAGYRLRSRDTSHRVTEALEAAINGFNRAGDLWNVGFYEAELSGRFAAAAKELPHADQKRAAIQAKQHYLNAMKAWSSLQKSRQSRHLGDLGSSAGNMVTGEVAVAAMQHTTAPPEIVFDWLRSAEELLKKHKISISVRSANLVGKAASSNQ